MKYNFIERLALPVLLVVAMISCKDDKTEPLNLSRMFSPTGISTTNDETQVTISWNASLFATSGTVDYQVDVSQDSAGFSNIAYSTTTKDASLIITDDKLTIKQNYYARIKALGQNGASDSKWLMSPPFKILGEQYLLQVASADIIDVAVILRWKPHPGLTKITITPSGETPYDIALTDDDNTAAMKMVTGLIASTTYSAEIFLGDKDKGTISFTTKDASATGDKVIDLRTIVGKPTILIDTLPDIASGSIVVLKRGQVYNVSAQYAFDKSVTIISGLDFGSNLAAINLTSNFNFVANSTVDSVVFKDIIFKGVRSAGGSYSADYIINVNVATTVGKIRLENCTAHILRGVVRLQASGAGAKIANYVVNNCLIDSIREYGIATASSASAFANISITNTTMYKARRFMVGVAGTNNITIQNCTFNELPSDGTTAGTGTNYFLDYNTTNVTNGVTITNCLFGGTWAELAPSVNGGVIQGYRVGTSTTVTTSSCYAMSDFVMSANPLPSVSSYSGSSTSVFTDPTNGNFKVKDAAFPGKSVGDPRWK